LRVKTEPSDNISASQEDSLGDFYVVTSRQVTWKRLDLAVLACRELERNLIVIGEGPEHNNLVKMAEGADFIKFIPLLKKEELAGYLGRAKGYLFPSMEPFGIAPVEALAVSCPVVAFGEGGAVDYIKDGENGVFFQRQEVKSLEKAILRFEKIKFNKEIVKKTADRFSEERFDEEIRRVIQTTQTTRAGK
ncbi:MAG: glycosyltransferase, partial [Candidatus Saccharibacteria bacterium]|nr:glycosyltransferase [Candidatus Saccharibacteria bacterium]